MFKVDVPKEMFDEHISFVQSAHATSALADDDGVHHKYDEPPTGLPDLVVNRACAAFCHAT